MNTVDRQIEQAEKICCQHGSRLTAKRRQVLSGLLRSGKALSAYELIDFCKQQDGASLPAMSVYRILGFLEREHLVHKLNLANKYVACAHIDCAHEHGVAQFVICKQCQRVEEISISESIVAELESNVRRVGFNLASPQFEMNCICQDCLAAQQ